MTRTVHMCMISYVAASAVVCMLCLPTDGGITEKDAKATTATQETLRVIVEFNEAAYDALTAKDKSELAGKADMRQATRLEASLVPTNARWFTVDTSKKLLPANVNQPSVLDGLGNHVESFYYSTSSGSYIFQAKSLAAKGEMMTLLASSGSVKNIREDRQMKLMTALGEAQSSIIAATVNDTLANWQWSLEQVGAQHAWPLTTGIREVIVAVVDTGLDVDHPDLRSSLWVNTGEIAGNGVDDDGNGYIDDVHGWDFGANEPLAIDYSDHGTHCAGIVGAAANNSFGTVGIAPNVSIMALAVPELLLSQILQAMDYAIEMGAHITSNSWGSESYEAELHAAIGAAADADVLFVVAAGNMLTGTSSYQWPGEDPLERCDNDQRPQWPTNDPGSNVLSVASNSHLDIPSSFTCYGNTTVHLFAPGGELKALFGNDHSVGVISSVPDGFAWFRGTSMAAPLVAGAAALVLSLLQQGGHPPQGRAALAKRIVLDSVDVLPQYGGYCVSGGRLNVSRALLMAMNAPVASYPPGGAAVPPPAPPLGPGRECVNGEEPPLLGLQGPSNLQNYSSSAAGDDVFVPLLPTTSMQPSFNFAYLGTSYAFSEIFVSSNMHLTFGEGSKVFSGFGPSVPSLPAWLLGAADTSALSYYAGVEDQGSQQVVRLRWEGHCTTSGGDRSAPTIVYEIIFFPDQKVSITFGPNPGGDPATPGAWGLTNGRGALVTALPACQYCTLLLCGDPQGNSWSVSRHDTPAMPSAPPMPPAPPALPVPPAPAVCLKLNPVDLSLLGPRSLPDYSVVADDDYRALLPEAAEKPGFSFHYLGVAYDFSQIYISSNMYITFGQGSDEFQGLNLSSPPLPSWLLGAADTSALSYYAGLEMQDGKEVVRLRWEGHGSSGGGNRSSPTIVYEVTFSPGQHVAIVIGPHSYASSGFWALGDGRGGLVAALQPCQYCAFHLCSDAYGNDWQVSQVLAGAANPPPSPPPAEMLPPALQPPPPAIQPGGAWPFSAVAVLGGQEAASFGTEQQHRFCQGLAAFSGLELQQVAITLVLQVGVAHSRRLTAQPLAGLWLELRLSPVSRQESLAAQRSFRAAYPAQQLQAALASQGLQVEVGSLELVEGGSTTLACNSGYARDRGSSTGVVVAIAVASAAGTALLLLLLGAALHFWLHSRRAPARHMVRQMDSAPKDAVADTAPGKDMSLDLPSWHGPASTVSSKRHVADPAALEGGGTPIRAERQDGSQRRSPALTRPPQGGEPSRDHDGLAVGALPQMGDRDYPPHKEAPVRQAQHFADEYVPSSRAQRVTSDPSQAFYAHRFADFGGGMDSRPPEHYMTREEFREGLRRASLTPDRHGSPSPLHQDMYRSAQDAQFPRQHSYNKEHAGSGAARMHNNQQFSQQYSQQQDAYWPPDTFGGPLLTPYSQQQDVCHGPSHYPSGQPPETHLQHGESFSQPWEVYSKPRDTYCQPQDASSPINNQWDGLSGSPSLAGQQPTSRLGSGKDWNPQHHHLQVDALESHTPDRMMSRQTSRSDVHRSGDRAEQALPLGTVSRELGQRSLPRQPSQNSRNEHAPLKERQPDEMFVRQPSNKRTSAAVALDVHQEQRHLQGTAVAAAETSPSPSRDPSPFSTTAEHQPRYLPWWRSRTAA